MTYYIAQNQNGPLPQKYPFDLPISGDVTIAFSGSCYCRFTNGIAGVRVNLDDVHIGDVPLYFNNANQHLTLPTAFFAVNLEFGPHTITLSPLTDHTLADKNDYFSLWIVD